MNKINRNIQLIYYRNKITESELEGLRDLFFRFHTYHEKKVLKKSNGLEILYFKN